MANVSAQYSVIVTIELDARQEPLGKLTAAIAGAGGQIVAVDLIPGAGAEGKRVREFTIDATDPEHWERILRGMGSVRGARVVEYQDRTMQMHRGGKISVENKYPVKTRDDLSMAYTPGVARVCMSIHEERSRAFEYTIKKNTVAIVSDGTAVLGLGDIGPEAAMPVALPPGAAQAEGEADRGRHQQGDHQDGWLPGLHTSTVAVVKSRPANRDAYMLPSLTAKVLPSGSLNQAMRIDPWVKTSFSSVGGPSLPS